MRLFKVLTPAEEATFRQSARDNYKPLVDPINPLWHPAYQDECAKMNSEAGWNIDLDNPTGGSATLLRPARDTRNADRIDGYDRDDLGESFD